MPVDNHNIGSYINYSNNLIKVKVWVDLFFVNNSRFFLLYTIGLCTIIL